MKKTGYVVVDCTGIDLLAQSKKTVAGIFDQVKAAYACGKPIFASGCEYGSGVPITPMQVMCLYEGGRYCLTASILQVWVDDEDGVTIVSLLS